MRTTAFSGVKRGIPETVLTGETPCSMMLFLSDAPLAQLDRALDYESSGQRFESSRARHVCPNVGTPLGVSTFPEAIVWANVDQAEKSYRNWNTKGACANCREPGFLPDRTVGAKLGKGDFRSEKWGRAYASFEKLASLDLHLEGMMVV